MQNQDNNEIPSTDEIYSYHIKIPKDRIAVLIGIKGMTKRKIESELNIKLIINSEEGDVYINSKDSLLLLTARNVIKAIARGFNPEIALKLINPSYLFELLDINDYVQNSNHLGRVKGRIIGTKGKARHQLELTTDTKIVVYGKTVGIIGKLNNVMMCKTALENLMNGAKHQTVYKKIEREKKSDFQMPF